MSSRGACGLLLLAAGCSTAATAPTRSRSARGCSPTPASRSRPVSPLLAVRDAALAVVGDAGPGYTITDVVEDPNPHIRRRILGTMHVPLFLDQATPDGKMVYDAAVSPLQNGFADYPFLVQIPQRHQLYARRDPAERPRAARQHDRRAGRLHGDDLRHQELRRDRGQPDRLRLPRRVADPRGDLRRRRLVRARRRAAAAGHGQPARRHAHDEGQLLQGSDGAVQRRERHRSHARLLPRRQPGRDHGHDPHGDLDGRDPPSACSRA